MTVYGILEIAVPLCILALWAGVAAKKVNPAKPLWAYGLLTLLPLWLWLSVSGVLRLFFSFSVQDQMLGKVLYTLLGAVYAAQLVLIPYLLIKLMKSPAVEQESGFMAATARGRMANARRQMHYGVYANVVIGVLCVLPICLIIGYLAVGVLDATALVVTQADLSAEGMRPGMFVLMLLILPIIPLYGWMIGISLAVVAGIVGVVGLVAAVIVVALSLNGGIRALRAREDFKAKHNIVYCCIDYTICIYNCTAAAVRQGQARRLMDAKKHLPARAGAEL